MADADAKFRDELDLVLGHRGAISNTRINAILDIAFDFTYVKSDHLIFSSLPPPFLSNHFVLFFSPFFVH